MAIKKITAIGFDKDGKAYKYHFPLNRLLAFEEYAVKYQPADNKRMEKQPFVYANYYLNKQFWRRQWFQHFGKYKQ